MRWVRQRFRLVKYLSLGGLPTQLDLNRFKMSRILRLGESRWLKILYSATGEDRDGNPIPLPGGRVDNLWIWWIINMAVANKSPVVYWDELNPLLDAFGLREDIPARTRARLDRIAGLMITFSEGNSLESVKEQDTSELVRFIERRCLPPRGESGQPLIPGEKPRARYGVVLSPEMWETVSSLSQQHIVDVDLIRHFLRRPIALNYAFFLLARSSRSRKESVVDAKDVLPIISESWESNPRVAMNQLRQAHEDLRNYFRDEHSRCLLAKWEPGPPERGDRGRPKKTWRLRIGPKLLE